MTRLGKLTSRLPTAKRTLRTLRHRAGIKNSYLLLSAPKAKVQKNLVHTSASVIVGASGEHLYDRRIASNNMFRSG